VSPKPSVRPLRREQIVRATVRCLSRDGYARLTMKRVAREAGVSQGILHYYFRDKRAILVATLEAVVADLDRRVAAAQRRGGRDANARLAALVGVCVDSAVRRRELWAVFIEFWGEMLHDRRLAEINADQYARMRGLVGALVAQGIREGRFRRVDARAAGAVVLGLVDGVSLQVLFDPGALTPTTATRLCVEAARRYLEGHGREP